MQTFNVIDVHDLTEKYGLPTPMRTEHTTIVKLPGVSHATLKNDPAKYDKIAKEFKLGSVCTEIRGPMGFDNHVAITAVDRIVFRGASYDKFTLLSAEESKRVGFKKDKVTFIVPFADMMWYEYRRELFLAYTATWGPNGIPEPLNPNSNRPRR